MRLALIPAEVHRDPLAVGAFVGVGLIRWNESAHHSAKAACVWRTPTVRWWVSPLLTPKARRGPSTSIDTVPQPPPMISEEAGLKVWPAPRRSCGAAVRPPAKS